jgi:hypothetical protein
LISRKLIQRHHGSGLSLKAAGRECINLATPEVHFAIVG